jgi:hypothetical protein
MTKTTHHAPIIRRTSDYPAEMGRFANTTKMVFHPTDEHPTEPNAGILTYMPGAGFPLHKHDFAQVWYIIEGECQFGGDTLGPGDMVYMPPPTLSMKCTLKTAAKSCSSNTKGRRQAHDRSMKAASTRKRRPILQKKI